jgi:ribosome biogenesis protein YTM1
MASGSWDGQVSIWTTDVPEDGETVTESHDSKKKRKVEPVLKTKSPLTDLYGHAGPVSSVVFQKDGDATAKTLFSGSWEHTVRVWDIDSRVNTNTMVHPCRLYTN